MTTFLETARRTLAVSIGFSIPISTALTNILCPLALLLILAEKPHKEKFHGLLHHPVASIALLLFAVMLLGFSYTSVSWSDAGLMLDKYRELLYIPLFIIIFRDDKTRQWGLYAFLSAMGLTLFLSYLMALTGWDLGKGTPETPFVFKNYITQSLLMALATYLVAVQVWKENRWTGLRSVVVALAIYNILFMSEGRTGYLVLFCLILLFSYQVYQLRGLFIGSVILIIISFFIYIHSDVVQNRVNKLSENLRNYQQGETETSVGLRLEFYQNSLVLIAKNPLLGTGTGSFSYEYQKLAQPQGIHFTTNPHNEYLMIAAQWGLIGSGLFIYLLYQMWQNTRRLTPQSLWMARGLVVAMAVGCLVNSLLLDTTEGHIFAYLTGVFYGGLSPVGGQSIKGLSTRSKYQKTILVSIMIIFCLLITYRTFVTRNQEALINIEPQLLEIMVDTIKTPFPIVGSEDRARGIALDIEGIATPINTQFVFRVKSNNRLNDKNNYALLVSKNIAVSSQIEIDEKHVGETAHIVMMASYQPPDEEVPTLFFQRCGEIWETLDMTRLKPALSYSQLPARINLPIYQGSLVAPGRIQVFIGYIIEDKNKLILSPQPLTLVVTEPTVLIEEKVLYAGIS